MAGVERQVGPCAAAAAELVTQPPVTLLLSEWLLQVFDQVLILKRMTHVESPKPLLTGVANILHDTRKTKCTCNYYIVHVQVRHMLLLPLQTFARYRNTTNYL